MSSFGCSFCQHFNPIDAKYCNECGSTLRLRPCEQCDAVNDLDAANCYQCGRRFHQPGPLPATVAAEPAESRPEVCSSVVRAVENSDIGRLQPLHAPSARAGLVGRGRRALFARRFGSTVAVVAVIAAGGATLYGGRESPPVGTAAAIDVTLPGAAADAASTNASRRLATPTHAIGIALEVSPGESGNNGTGAGGVSLDLSPALAPAVQQHDADAVVEARAARTPSSATSDTRTSTATNAAEPPQGANVAPASGGAATKPQAWGDHTSANAVDDRERARVARRARNAMPSKPTADRERLRPTTAARGASPRENAPIADVQPPPYRTPSGICTDNVAALGLCTRQAAPRGG
jgi:hypothetical protein